MTRHNYAPSFFARRFGALRAPAHPPRLRGSSATVAAALAAVALTSAVEAGRVRTLDGDLAEMTRRSESITQTAARVTALDADVARLTRIDALLTAARRDALRGVNELALIGNRLPERTWLTAVRAARDGSWSIEGRSGRVLEIGSTLGAIAAIDGARSARLVSVAATAEPARTLRFTIAWERRP